MKKRVLSLLLVLMMIVSLVPAMALAEDDIVAYAVTGGNIYFNKSTGEITDCDSEVTEANIPSEIDGVKVTGIGYKAFGDCTGLTSITIPNSVTYISGGFGGCTGLTSITIPNSVTVITYFAFSGCTGLTSVKIPDSVTSISECAFGSCTGLTSITIPNSVAHIGWGVFQGCTSLTSITLPSSVISIDECVFLNCPSLTDVYYTGTEEQWNAINILGGNEALLNATIHYDYHEHVTELRGAVEPTCTEEGYSGDEVCTICGDVISQGEVIEATGHHFKGNTCTDCGATRSTGDTIRAFFQTSFNNFRSFFDKLFGR